MTINLRYHPSSRGSVMIFGMVLVTILAILSMSYASRMVTNELRLEADVTGSQALQLAHTATAVKMKKLWREYGLRRTDQRVAWLGGEDQNGDRMLNSGEDANYNAALTGPLGLNYDSTYLDGSTPRYPVLLPSSVAYGSDANYVSFGHGEAKVTAEVVKLNKKESVDIRFTTTARVNLPYGLDGKGNARRVTRTIERVVRYGLGPAQVFDFVYFANNYGWMYGNGLNLYGGMGANGNLGFSGTPKVDGKLFAAKNDAIGAAGVVNGTPLFDTVAQYKSLATKNTTTTSDDVTQMRPTNPAYKEDVNNNGVLDAGEDLNTNGTLDRTDYDIGYDGTQPRETQVPQIDMPYLGDLSMYRDLSTSYSRAARPELGEPAASIGSVVKQLKPATDATTTKLGDGSVDPSNPDNYNVLINQTYGYTAGQNGKYTTHINAGAPNGGKGANNVWGTSDDERVVLTDIPAQLDTTTQAKNGNLALIGTDAQPIVIMGPVVVSNDLVIKGKMKGQGTFYVGRNTHVVGDLTYTDPPKWTQDDPNFNTTVADNKLKDGVGFGTKGSVILGNYTQASLSGGNGSDSWSSTVGYMKPSFTTSHKVDESDRDLGYVTSGADATATFHGDYTALDTGKRYSDTTVAGVKTPVWTTTPTTATRRYYESSFPTAYINSIAVKPQHMHGIFYTNHMFGGRTNALKMYGNMVTRDEAIVTNTSADFYYDPRISKGELSSYIELFLPRNSIYNSIMTREVPAKE